MARRYLRAIFHFDVEKITSFPEQQEPEQQQELQQEPAWRLPGPEREQPEQQQEPEQELLLFSCSRQRKQEPW